MAEEQRRQLAQEIVDRISKDEAFRNELVDDPRAALESAGFGDRLHDPGDAAGSSGDDCKNSCASDSHTCGNTCAAGLTV